MDIDKELEKIVEGFHQLPYLFVGTGLSRRYSTAPDWDGLLMDVWNELNDGNKERYNKFINGIAYELGITNLTDGEIKYSLNPEIATVIQSQFNSQFNAEYYKNEKFETRIFTKDESSEIVKNNFDPFKYYIAKLMAKLEIAASPSDIHPIKELQDLKINSNKIAGIITTNYDYILEKIFPDFEVCVGQDNLLTANLTYAFGIFKIHGSCDKPSTITITKNDYDFFSRKLKYLSAKLLTIFVEHPVIFLGYNISDLNIRNILQQISECLNKEQLERMKNNLIFIRRCDYGEDEIRIKEIVFKDKSIAMTEIKLYDFSKMYRSLSMIKSKMPVKIMRMMQDMVTNYVYSTTATNNIIFGNINSPDIDNNTAAMYVGAIDNVSQMGFSSFEILDILEDIILDNKPFLVNDKLITQTFKNIRKLNAKTYLPVYKYLRKLNLKASDLPENYYIITSLKDINLNTTEEKYIKHEQFNNISEILYKYPNHIIKQICNIRQLIKDNKISTDELGMYLVKNYENEMYFGKGISAFKKLTAIYDYLKYKK